MKAKRPLLREIVIFSLPLAVLLVYAVLTLLVSFYTGEIENFHGYPVRGVRVGGLKAVVQQTLSSINSRASRRYIARVARRDGSTPTVRQCDGHVDGESVDRLAGDLPASGREWLTANLVEGLEWVPVKVHYRGQQMSNYFWPKKAWKIKTPQKRLVDGYRVINLTPAMNRLDTHLTFLAAGLAGLEAPRSRLVQLFLNLKDQGLYLQEEQIDESMIRRIDRMPGDIFYGELYFPNEPKMSSDELFWNPYLWRKKARNNTYPEEYRPYLTELLDAVSNPSLDSYSAIYQLLDMEQFARYLAVINFQGDLHVDHSHNHRLYFNPLSGRFEGLLWNSRLTLFDQEGVESMANRFFRKLARDPRFLDRVQKVLHDDLYRTGATKIQLAELERIRTDYGEVSLNRPAFERNIELLRSRLESRSRAVEQFLGEAEVRFLTTNTDANRLLSIFAKAAGSLRLRHLELDAPAAGLRLFEDRDLDGILSPGDREVRVQAVGDRLAVVEDEVSLFTGRDFRAPYTDLDNGDRFSSMRDFTRLAFLESPFVLVANGSQPAPRIIGLGIDRTIGDGLVSIEHGPPESYIATETIHPWRFEDPAEPRSLYFKDTVELVEDLTVGERDALVVEPGTVFLLGPGVSMIVESMVHLDGVEIRRLDPEQPWGVLALQGKGASGSTLENCRVSGGSEATVRHVYYSGMLSVHLADDVTVRDCVFSDNLLGDDTVRFAAAKNLEISGVRVLNANGDAIDCDISQGTISDTAIINPRNDGVDLMTSKVDLQRLEIRGAGDKGISFGERASSVGLDLTIDAATTGIAIKDGSAPSLTKVTVTNSVIGVDGFDKNWRYPGGGRGRLKDCRLSLNDIDVRLDAVSELVLEDCTTDASFEIFGGLESGRLQLVEGPVGESLQ